MHVKYPIEIHTLEIKDLTTLIHDVVCNCTVPRKEENDSQICTIPESILK